MSGYSFDVDPLGGAYVVRQWVDNLPHWQTLAQPEFAGAISASRTIVIQTVEREVWRRLGGSLFDRLGRAVCEAGCLPRKELYEAWEVARRVRRWCRGGRPRGERSCLRHRWPASVRRR